MTPSTPGTAALRRHDGLVASPRFPPHGVHFCGGALVAWVGHVACRRRVVVLNVVPMGPAIISILKYTEGVLGLLLVVLLMSLLKSWGAHCCASLLHVLPCLVLPASGGGFGVPILGGLLLCSCIHNLLLHLLVIVGGGL